MASPAASSQPSPRHLRWKETFPSSVVPISVRLYRSEHAARTLLHDHDFMEISLVTSGHGTHCTIHGEQPIGAGDVFILRPGAWHAYKDCRALAGFNCCFGVELLRGELAALERDPAINYLLWGAPLALGFANVYSSRAAAAVAA